MTKPKQKPITYAEIDTRAIASNYRALAKVCAAQHSGTAQLLPVIKAEAYGHGMIETARVLRKEGVKFFCVSDLPEGKKLRENGFRQKILLLETTLSQHAGDIVKQDLTPSVCTLEFAKELNKRAAARRKISCVHIKIDTGMGRLGVSIDKAEDFIRKVAGFSHLTVEGVFTHFPVADTQTDFTKAQIERMRQLIHRLEDDGISIKYVHAANSMGLAGYRTDFLNLARPGLMLYGVYPVDRLKKKIELKSVMSVKTRVVFVKKVKRGQGISYGHTFVAPRAMTVATLAIGYSDGYLRSLSNRGQILIGGKKCPVIGRVTMDQIMVDASRVKGLKLGQEAVVLGKQGRQEITADDLAQRAATISYEIMCAFGNVLPKILL